MLKKIGAFFGNFLHNFAADPVSTGKGLVQLAAAGATCYGMATGAVPYAQGVPLAGGLAASGIHALGTDSAGTTAPAAAKTEELVSVASAVAPAALTISDHFDAIKKQGGEAQAVLDTIAAANATLAVLTPVTPPDQPQA